VRADPLEVVRDHLQTPPPLPRMQGAQISAELERVILRALAKQPDKRWQSAEELSRELLTVPELGGQAAVLTPAQPLGSAPTEMALTPSAPLPALGHQGMLQPLTASSPGLALDEPGGPLTPAAYSSPAWAAVGRTPSRGPSQLGMVPSGEAPSETHALGWRVRLRQLPGRVQQLPWRHFGERAQGLPQQAWTRVSRLPWGSWLERLGRERRLQLIAGSVAALMILVCVLLARHRTPPPTEPAPQPLAAAATTTVTPEGQRHLATAVMYQRKLWCSDALEELEQALRNDAGLRGDDDVLRTAIACLTPKTRDKALHFLVERVGEPARAPLAAAVVSDPNGEVRRGARMALDRLPPATP
jgi:hypothetical protein